MMDHQHLHLFISYLPTLGVFGGIIVFLLGFLLKSYEIKIAAYILFIISAIGELIIYLTGDGNYSIYPLITFIVLGIVAIIGIILTIKKSRFAKNFDSIILIMVIAAFGLIAWKSSLAGMMNSDKNSKSTVSYMHHEHEKGQIPPLDSSVQLNNGQRWIADDAARRAISDLQELTNTLSNDPVLLRQSLQQRINRLFQECTMQGEADKQLHHFLIPLMDEIKQLNENSSTADIESIQSYLETFQRYFK